MADNLKAKEILLNGKLITSRDPATIGENNFQALTNLRYTDTNPQGVLGMTKINKTTALTSAKIRSGFHFRKDSPAESHVLVQSFNAGETQGYIYNNETAIPSQGDFTTTPVLTQESGAGTAVFSTAPSGYAAMCDKKGAYVWGGNEAEIGSFITSTATIADTITNPKDFTKEVRNTLSTTSESAVIGGGIDSYAKFLLPCNGADDGTTFTDSIGTHTPVARGNCVTDTAQAKFGASSALFDGNADWIEIPDHADLNLSTGLLAIEGQVRFNAVTGQHCFYSQSVDAATKYDHIALFQDHDAGKIYFSVMSGGVRLILESGTWAPVANTWYHVMVIRGWGAGANAWAITVDGTAVATWTANITMPDLAGVGRIGNLFSSTSPDFGAVGHPVTLDNTSATSAAQAKFGSGSLYLGGVADYVTIPDHANWDLSTQTNFTLGGWFKFSDHAGTETLFEQWEGVNDRWYLHHVHGSGLRFIVVSGGVEIVDTGFGGEITDTDWHYIMVCKVGDDYGIYVDTDNVAHDNSSDTDTFTGLFAIGRKGDSSNYLQAYINDVMLTHTNYFSAAPSAGLTDTITVPTAALTSTSDFKLLLPFNSMCHNGWMDEIMLSKGAARQTSTFIPPARPYSITARTWVVGSFLPLRGTKFYIANPNTVASTMTVKEWNGFSWNSLSVTDNTASGGVTLAQTGTVTWSSTESTSKVKYLNGSIYYWYQFAISDGDADIYYATTSAPMQPVKDIWDGIERECLAFYHYDNGTYLDYSTNIFKDSYDSTNTGSYAVLDSLEHANDFLLCGFAERMMGLSVSIKLSNNAAAGGNIGIAVKYWDGNDWATAGAMNDETAVSSKSFSESGIITWTPPDESEEFQTDIQSGVPLYYYKLEFDTTDFGNEVEVYYVAGLPSPKKVNAYGFPVHAGSALWLLADQNGKKNKVLKCAPNTVSFWNGDESVEFEIGDDNELMSGAAVYIQLGSNLYEVVLLCKRHETWMVLPGTDNTIQKFRISDKVGCVAPSTMKAMHLGSLEQGGGKSVVMWQGAEGIYMFDGKAPIKVSEDIDDLFDKSNSDGLNRTYIDDSYGEFDVENWSYRWLCRTGATATWDEWIFDLKRGRWYHVDRGAAKALKCAVSVMDTTGNFYSYGGIETGYLERLNYGTDFDGNDIVHTLKGADFVLNEGKVSRTAIVRNIRLVGAAKNTTSNKISVSYYKDTNTSADESFELSPAASGKRIFQAEHGMGREGPGTFHCFNFSMTTDDETIGFEPMFLSILYKETGTTKGR